MENLDIDEQKELEGFMAKMPQGNPNIAVLPPPGTAEIVVTIPETVEEAAVNYMLKNIGEHVYFCNTYHQWLTHNGIHYKWSGARGPAAPGELYSKVRKLALKRYKDAVAKRQRHEKGAVSDKEVGVLLKQTETSKYETILKIMASERLIEVDKVDGDINLIGVKNGVIDLKTCTFRVGNLDDIVTMSMGCEYNPDADCPIFKEKTLEVLGGEQEKFDCLMNILAYSLSGDQSEKIFSLFHGFVGNNGKSIILNTALELFGDYGTCARNSIMTKQKNDSQFANADLENKRFVWLDEPSQHDSIDSAKLKKLVGNDPITVEKKGIDPHKVKPTQHYFWGTNHLMGADDTGPSFWDRVVLFGCPNQYSNDRVKYPNALPEVVGLGEEILKELPGILNLVLKYRVEFLKKRAAGLGKIEIPQSMRKAVDEYKEKEDQIANFIYECCDLGSEYRTNRSDVYARYLTWIGKYPIKNTRFYNEMDNKNIKKLASGGINWLLGIKLKPFTPSWNKEPEEPFNTENSIDTPF